MTISDSDEALMQRFKRGDCAAFEILYTRHKGGIYRYFLRQCSDRALAEEMHQDVWLRLVDMRARYKPNARFTTMLYTMAHNRLIDHYRRSSRVQMQSYEQDLESGELEYEAAVTTQPERQVQAQAELAQLIEAVEGLPAAQRETFLMKQETDLSIEEIATATGVNRETAKSRLRYAMTALRRAMSGSPEA